MRSIILYKNPETLPIVMPVSSVTVHGQSISVNFILCLFYRRVREWKGILYEAT